VQIIIYTPNTKSSNALRAFIKQKEHSFPISCLKVKITTIANQAIISSSPLTLAFKFHRDIGLLIFISFNDYEFGEKRSSIFLYIFFCGEIYRSIE